MSFSDRLRIIQKETGLSQRDFASSFGASSAHISKLLNSQAKPSEMLIKAICLRWNVREEWLKLGVEPMKSPLARIDEAISDDHDLSRELLKTSLKYEQALVMEDFFLPGFHSLAHVVKLILDSDVENLQYVLNAILLEWQARDDKEKMRLEIRLEDCIPNFEALKAEMQQRYADNKERVEQRRNAVSSYNSDSIAKTSFSVPIVGRAAAGTPIEMIETRDETLDVEDTTIRRGDFVVIADGDSMIGAGIHDGDHVVIRPQPMVENGEIALVAVGDGSTIKRFYVDENGYQLRPANAAYPVQKYDRLADVRVLGRYISSIQPNS